MAKDKKSIKKEKRTLESPLKLKPLKAKNLKIIDHLGTLYATFDGSSLWKLDRAAFNVLRMCNGKKTVDQLVEEVSKRILHKPEDVEPVIRNVLTELEKMKFIKWI